MELSLRFATSADVPALTEILNQAIRTRVSTGFLTEFTTDDRMVWFNEHNEERYPIYVAEADGIVVGYSSLSPYRAGRQAFDRVAEVSFFVHEDHHRKGVGERLLQHALNDRARVGIPCLVAILTDLNGASIGLLKKLGFSEWGNLPNIIDLEGTRASHLFYGIDG